MKWEQEHLSNDRYTLEMVRIDDKVKEIITKIKLEEAILDKLGEKSIKWEDLGINYDNKINRITYEEVIYDTRPIQTKKVLGVEVGTRASV